MGAVVRKQDWPSLLDAFFLENRTTPFNYGTWDCCLAAVKAIKVITNVNVIKDFPSWRNKKEAMALIVKYRDIENMAKLIAYNNDINEISVNRATAGDILLYIKGPSEQTLGIMGLNGREVYVPNDVVGWTLLSFKLASRAWRI